jgi:putative transposase
MPRRPRTELAGGVHHVTARGNRRADIFRSDRDRSTFLRLLGEATRRYDWRCLSYCLMPNHVHLVLETLEPTLGDGMRWLNSRYAVLHNLRRPDPPGRLFGERFKSSLVDVEDYLAQVLRYVALNPVKAGMVPHAGAWPWSSHRALAGLVSEPLVAAARVEELLAVWGGDPGGRYLRLFEDEQPSSKDLATLEPTRPRPPLGDLLAAASLDAGLRLARAHGYALEDIAAATGLHASTVSRRVRRVHRAERRAA